MINPKITVEDLNKMCENTMIDHLSIVFTEIGCDYIKAKMPVDNRHHQPLGLLHGGANVTLAETLGGVASQYSIDTDLQFCVGLEINANHIKSVKTGYVLGIVSPVHIGKSTHIWEIKITDEQDQLVCVSRITMAILNKK